MPKFKFDFAISKKVIFGMRTFTIIEAETKEEAEAKFDKLCDAMEIDCNDPYIHIRDSGERAVITDILNSCDEDILEFDLDNNNWTASELEYMDVKAVEEVE